MLCNYHDKCGLCHTSGWCEHQEQYVNLLKTKIDKVIRFLVINSFEITDSSQENFPMIEIKSTKNTLFSETDRLCHILRKNGVIIRPNVEKNNVWAPSVQATYDPGKDETKIYLYGVDDEVLAGIKEY